MTAAEVYELTTQGGTSDFARVIELCEQIGPYCLIGGLAVNCYVEPVYTVDADLVIVAEAERQAAMELEKQGFRVQAHPHSLNAETGHSQLRIQFTTDRRYQAFLARAEDREVLGVRTRVACLEDVLQGKVWAYSDPQRRLTTAVCRQLQGALFAKRYSGRTCNASHALQSAANRLKCKKDELDLLRIGEAYPSVRGLLPPELQQLLASE